MLFGVSTTTADMHMSFLRRCHLTADVLNLSCRFVKWHGNDGRVSCAEELLQAFSHFTHKHMQLLPTPEQGVVVDIQVVLTDPAIHCTSDNRRYGDTNMGREGIDSFFKEHNCNHVCHALSL